MKKSVIALIIIFVLQSCETTVKRTKERDNITEWYYVKTLQGRKQTPAPSWLQDQADGYTLFDNGLCNYHPGFLRHIEGSKTKKRKTIFLGTQTKYKMENDSLKIFDLATKEWIGKRIVSITRDTLTLRTGDSLVAKYARLNYNINENEHYDKIIVSSSGCFGSCAIADVSIDKSGKVVFNGTAYNTKNGLFSGKVSSETYKKLETDFKKAGIMTLKDSYSAHWTDDEDIDVTFIKDNKIVKCVSDYGGQSPVTFLWAYTRARYLYQQANLTLLKNEKSLPIWGMAFRDGKKNCRLSKSESFYLLGIIAAGKTSTATFTPKYAVLYWDTSDKEQTIYSDGRFFRFPDKRVVDIGYDFLKANEGVLKFESIEEN